MNGIEVAVAETARIGGRLAIDPLLQAGPPADLPGPVPAFVERLLGAIGEFVGSTAPAGGR